MKLSVKPEQTEVKSLQIGCTTEDQVLDSHVDMEQLMRTLTAQEWKWEKTLWTLLKRNAQYGIETTWSEPMDKGDDGWRLLGKNKRRKTSEVHSESGWEDAEKVEKQE